MKLALIMTFTLVLIVGGGELAFVEWNIHQAERALTHKDWAAAHQATILLAHMKSSRFVLLEINRIDALREAAALAGIRASVDALDFALAWELVREIMTPPASGSEGEARSWAERLPAIQAAHIDKLIHDGDLVAAIRAHDSLQSICAGMTLYAPLLAQVQSKLTVARAQKMQLAGDVRALLDLSSSDRSGNLPPDVQDKLEQMAGDAVERSIVDGQARGDIPAVYRLLAEAARSSRPTIRRRAVRIRAGVDSIMLGQDTSETPIEIAALAVIGASPLPGRAVVECLNTSGRTLRLVWRGQTSRDETLAPGSKKDIALPSGDYVISSLTPGGGRTGKVEPYLGVGSVEPRTLYRMVFSLQPICVDTPRDAGGRNRVLHPGRRPDLRDRSPGDQGSFILVRDTP